MKLSPCPPEEPYCALYKPHSLHQPFVYKCVPASNKAIAERCKQSGECYTQLHNGGVLITVCCCHNYECQIQLSPILETILEKIVIREKRLLTIAKLGIQKRKQNYAVTNMRTLSTNTALKFPSSQSSNCTRRMRTGSAERMTTL
uniref:Protein sleepless n=1 Tax=Heterorhabditis bacteriophora TaxID=37862 RepID=A0A1I7XBG7_HETBA